MICGLSSSEYSKRNTNHNQVMTGRFTFDKVVSSGDLSGPLGYQGIHHMDVI